MKISRKLIKLLLFNIILVTAVGCTSSPPMDTSAKELSSYEYLLGPGDVVDVFVWRNEDLSAEAVPVRPDGRISTPLVEDLMASGKSPKQLAREIEQHLSRYIKDPFVTITVRQFIGQLEDRIRVVGEAANPQALPYTDKMTLLDVMIAVGGLTEFAAGNRATLIRTINGKKVQRVVRLEDLIKHGDISANINMLPGDIIIIPEAWF